MGRALVGGSIELWLMYVHLFFDQSSLVFCWDITRPPLFIHWAIEGAKNDWIYMPIKVINMYNQSNINTDFILWHTQLIVYDLAYLTTKKYIYRPKFVIFSILH